MPRLGYSKSRTGCHKCRQRRVKCDEKRPCGACQRHGMPCSLVADADTGAQQRSGTEPLQTPSLPSPSARITTTRDDRADSEAPDAPFVYGGPSAAAAATSASASGILPGGVPAASSAAAAAADQERGWITDMELMHHYCTTAHRTMPRADEVGHIWQVEAVTAALQDTYLLHLILAFSAFHLAHLQPGRRAHYSHAAAQHQNLGLRGMRSALAELSEGSCHALFMAGSLLAVDTFAAMTVHAADPLDDRPSLDDVVEIYILLKGMNTVLSSWEPVIQLGPFRGLFDTSRPGAPARPFWDDVADRLERLRRPLADRIAADGGRIADDQPSAVASGIDCEILRLGDLSRHCLKTSSDPELRLIILWPISASDAFVQMLKDKEPASLVVLAYYCVVVQEAASRNWFTRGWAPKLLHAIRAGLPARYAGFLSWPLEHVRAEP